MTYYTNSKMFAQIDKKDDEAGEKNSHVTTTGNGQRLIALSEVGEASSLPDRIECVLSCSYTKKTIEEVKASTNKRIDYIIQTLHNNGLKDGQFDIHKIITLLDDCQYNMKAEVAVTFRDASSFENTVNLLVEKLEASVRVSEPRFYVSSEKVRELRRQACLNAVKNCRTKALSIAQYLNQSLGASLLVREENTNEFLGSFRSGEEASVDEKHIRATPSIQEKITNSTLTVHVKIYAEFECNQRTKRTPYSTR